MRVPSPNLLKTLERWILATHRFAIQKYAMFRVTSFPEILSSRFARSKTSPWVVGILHFLLGLKSNKSKVAEVKVFRNLPSGCTVFGLDDLRLQMDPLWCSLLTNPPKLGASSPGRDRNPMAPIMNYTMSKETMRCLQGRLNNIRFLVITQWWSQFSHDSWSISPFRIYHSGWFFLPFTSQPTSSVVFTHLNGVARRYDSTSLSTS